MILAGSLNFISGKPLVDGRSHPKTVFAEPIKPVEKLEQKPAEIKPVYCADYLKQYNWNQEVAHNVMMVESKNNARNLNDNPNTGDYSVGCFQINLLGGNQTAKYNTAVSLGYKGQNTREELREWLWNPKNNVAVAHKMWQESSWKPWSFTTCKKVRCY